MIPNWRTAVFDDQLVFLKRRMRIDGNEEVMLRDLRRVFKVS